MSFLKSCPIRSGLRTQKKKVHIAKIHGTQACGQPSLQKSIFGISAQKKHKNIYQSFLVLSNFASFLNFVKTFCTGLQMPANMSKNVSENRITFNNILWLRFNSTWHLLIFLSCRKSWNTWNKVLFSFTIQFEVNQYYLLKLQASYDKRINIYLA